MRTPTPPIGTPRNGRHNQCPAHRERATRTSSGRPHSRIATEERRADLPSRSVWLSILAVVGFEDPLGGQPESEGSGSVLRDLSGRQNNAFAFHFAVRCLPAGAAPQGPARPCQWGSPQSTQHLSGNLHRSPLQASPEAKTGSRFGLRGTSCWTVSPASACFGIQAQPLPTSSPRPAAL